MEKHITVLGVALAMVLGGCSNATDGEEMVVDLDLRVNPEIGTQYQGTIRGFQYAQGPTGARHEYNMEALVASAVEGTVEDTTDVFAVSHNVMDGLFTISGPDGEQAMEAREPVPMGFQVGADRQPLPFEFTPPEDMEVATMMYLGSVISGFAPFATYASLILPPEPVSTGDTWRGEALTNSGEPIHINYTFQGIVDRGGKQYADIIAVADAEFDAEVGGSGHSVCYFFVDLEDPMAFEADCSLETPSFDGLDSAGFAVIKLEPVP